MKGFIAVAVAALACGASAGSHHRHAHEHLFKKGANDTAAVCVPGCKTIYKTVTGEATLVYKTTKTQFTTVTQPPATPTAVTSEVVVVPTPQVQTCPTPGTYTFPATTVTVKETTTVCAAQTTKVPSGTHTIGGVTTVVVKSTTVVCPIATVHTTGGTTTSTIVMTTHVCPTPGTYTIAPTTTHVTDSTVIVYPVPTTICPGTYTAPAQTVTVTETGFVTVCPFTSKGLPTPSAAPAPPAAPKPAPKPAQPKPAQPKPKPSPPSSGNKPSTAGLTSTNDHWAIAYTPYQPSNGACKTAAEVEKDIAAIAKAQFTTVRVYGTDCSTLENVGPACARHGLKIILGVFVKSSCSPSASDIQDQINQLRNFAHWDIVSLVVTGNEAIQNGLCTPSSLKTLIQAVKSACSGKYNGPHTISETVNIWQESDVKSTLCDAVDVCGTNIHAIFNPNTTPSEAGPFVASQMKIVEGICGKQAVNLETGWRNSGSCNGVACASPADQATAIKSIRASAGHSSCFFSLYNDMWKPAGDQDWGLAELFGI